MSMFQIVLLLHIAGAIVSLAALLYGATAALRRKGNTTKLKNAFISLSVFEITTGMALALLRPSTASLTTFCLSGTALILMFWAVLIIADRRISLLPPVNRSYND